MTFTDSDDRSVSAEGKRKVMGREEKKEKYAHTAAAAVLTESTEWKVILATTRAA